MSDHLKIAMSGEELKSIRDVARGQGMTVTEWVREALAKACCHVAVSGGDRKLAAIRAAVRYKFPTADIDRMLSEIEPDSCGDG